MIETIQPDGWKAPKGYANGVLADGRLYIGGQIGWNADQVFETRRLRRPDGAGAREHRRDRPRRPAATSSTSPA